MYELIMFIHIVGVAVSFISLAVVCQQKSSENQKVMMIASFCGLISIVGYLFEIQARNVDEMLVTVQFGYIGKCYILVLMIIFTRNYCRVKLPAIIIKGIFVFNTFILLTIMTCKYHKFYYKEYHISNKGLFPHFVTQNGIGYYLYMFVTYSSVFYYCIVLIKQIRESESAEQKRLYLLLVAVILPAATMILFITGFADGVDLTPIGIIASCIILLIDVFKLGLLDTMDVAKDSIIDQTLEGVLVVDSDQNLLYINPMANKVAEQLREVYGITDFSSWIFSKSSNQFVFEVNNHQYETKIYPLVDANRSKGYIAWIYDRSFIDKYEEGFLL